MKSLQTYFSNNISKKKWAKHMNRKQKNSGDNLNSQQQGDWLSQLWKIRNKKECCYYKNILQKNDEGNVQKTVKKKIRQVPNYKY